MPDYIIPDDPPPGLSSSPPSHEIEAKPLDEAKVDDEAAMPDGAETHPLLSLGKTRKNVLFACFCLSMFIDSAGVSATFLSTAPISLELGVKASDEAWVPTSYGIAFASFLLLAGRLADIFSPKYVFVIGYGGLGLIYLGISLVHNQYGFFVLRGVSGLFAALTIPSSINMIVQMYPDRALQARKLALFGTAAAVASTIAPILVGVFLLASWRWYFRFIACVAVPFAGLAWVLLPHTPAVHPAAGKGGALWRILDLPGITLLIGALVTLILAFTQSGLIGWATPGVLVPLCLSLGLLWPAFLVWEHISAKPRKGHETEPCTALLPRGIWHFPNIFPLILQATVGPIWFCTVQLRLAVYFQTGLGDSGMITAAKLVPMGFFAALAMGASYPFPWIMTRPRFVQPVACVLAALGSFLIAFSGGGHGDMYYKYILASEMFGTFGAAIACIAMNTLIIQSFPPQYAGVAGSFVNTVFQVAQAIGMAIQSSLVSTSDGVEDWSGDQKGYIFVSCWTVFAGIAFMFWWRDPEPEVKDSEVVSTETVEGDVEKLAPETIEPKLVAKSSA